MKRKGLKKVIGISVLVIIVLFIIISFLVVNYFFGNYFSRKEKRDSSPYLRYSDYQDFYREIFTFSSGSETLTAYLYGADNTDNGLVVVSHGLGSNSEGYISEIKYFVDKGWMVFGFDNTGSGESTGDSCNGLIQSAIDLDNALKFIKDNPKFANLPVVLYGHSWGGFAVTAVLNYHQDIKAVVSCAGYNTAMQECVFMGKGIMGDFIYVEYPFMWIMQYAEFKDKAGLSAVEGINKAKDTKVMIIQGTEDDMVGCYDSSIYANRDKITNKNAEYILLKGRDHNEMYMDQSEERKVYFDRVNKDFEELCKKYDDDVPDDVYRQWCDSLDKELISRIDEELFDSINEFYLEAVS